MESRPSIFKRIEALERYFVERHPENLTSTVCQDGIDELGKEIVKLRREIGEMKTAGDKVALSEPLIAVMASVDLFQAFIAKADVIKAVIAHIGLFEFVMANTEAIQELIAKKTYPRGQLAEEGVAQGKGGDASKLHETIDRIEAAHKSGFESVDRIHKETIDEIGTIKGELEEVKMKVDLLAQSGCGTRETAKLNIREPKPYGGNRVASEVDNFLFDLEHYFAATRTNLDSERLGVVSMYLEEDAKLWWRHRAGLCTVNTWNDFKKDLKAQFSPENAAFRARCALNELQHTGSIREYIRAFQTINLDIPRMDENDRFYNFMKGLKPWARNELFRRGVNDHLSAIAAAESLDDFSGITGKRKFLSNSSSKTRPNKWGKPLNGGGERINLNSGGEKRTWNISNSERRPFNGNVAEGGNSQTTMPVSNAEPTKTFGPKSQISNPKPIYCFICFGSHKMARRPKKPALDVLLQEAESTENEGTGRDMSLRYLQKLSRRK